MLSSLFIPSSFLSLSSHPPHRPLSLSHTHMRTRSHTSHVSVWRDHLLQDPLYAAHGQKQKRTPESRRLLQLHLPPSLLCCSSSVRPVIPSSLIDHLSIVPAQLPQLLSPSWMCDIDSKVAALLTAATLLNISGSVSVAACLLHNYH